jgi:hypothetical protein
VRDAGFVGFTSSWTEFLEGNRPKSFTGLLGSSPEFSGQFVLERSKLFIMPAQLSTGLTQRRKDAETQSRGSFWQKDAEGRQEN